VAIQLFFSNQLEALADRYAAMVDLENQIKDNILEGPLTLVPNPNLVKWLQLTLAAKQSVFMNVDFQYLESGLWALLARLDPRKDRAALMTASHVRMFLFRELMGLRGEDPELKPLSRYLLGPGHKKGPGYAVRLWQLTERMVRLFEAYQFHRADMMMRWTERGYRPDGMERCQQLLFQRMREARDRYVKASKTRLLSLAEYADEVLGETRGRTGASHCGKFVHLFGLSQVSPFHLGLIGRLKGSCDVFIYSLNPCREFWEDIRTPQERKWVQRRAVQRLRITPEEQTQGELLDTEENELLALWGRPGREHIRLLCGVTDYDFEACFTRPGEPRSVLEAIQRRILTLSSETGTETRCPQDRSLQIVACPGITREVETVHNSIIHNLEADPHLQLTDIAVFVPDMSAYKPAIDSVFNRRPRRFSYNLVDSRADIESIYGQAVMAVLNLACGRFSRKEVFELILNPCFMDRWQIRFQDAEVWVEWAKALNMFHSFDALERASRGYPLGDAYTWKQGLQRLRLSRVLSAPEEVPEDRPSEPAGVFSFQGRVPFQDMHTGDTELMETFSVAMECLHRSVTGLRDLRTLGSEWAERFLRVCDHLLSVPYGLRGESAVKASLLAALEDLKIYDSIAIDGKGETGLDIGVIREFVKSHLASISGGYGDYLTEGVTISALQPMRPIPFRIVYVMGMEEGAFPGRAESASLDLRLLKRRIGDVSLPERNRYLFLEMLLSVRDKLYLSYVARDLQKDRLIQPCSVVNQLRRYVEQEVLPDGESFRVTEIPLKGSSERYLAPDAIHAASDVLVNYSLSDRVVCYREQGRLIDVDRDVTGRLKAHLQKHFPDFAFSAHRPQTEGLRIERITIRELRRFLEDPVSQYLKRHMGVFDDEETLQETTLKEDEPFYSQFPVDYELKMTPLRRWLDRCAAVGDGSFPSQGILEIYRTVYEGLRIKGATPDGAFARLDRKALAQDVSKRAETLDPVVKEMRASGEKRVYRAFFMGEQTGEPISPGNRFAVERFEPLKMRVSTENDQGEPIEVDVTIHGELPWIWQDRAGEWHTLILSGSGKTPGKYPDKYILEPVLFWICSLCTDAGFRLLGGSSMRFHVAYKKKAASWTYRIGPEAARRYLTRLVSDYLSRRRPEWLPFQTVTSSSLRPLLMEGCEIQEGDRESFYVELLEAYSEETAILMRLVDPDIPEDALDKARERFGIFIKPADSEKTQDVGPT